MSVRPSTPAPAVAPALRPVLSMKVDELFLRWLGDPHTRRALREELGRLQGAGPGDVIRDRGSGGDVIRSRGARGGAVRGDVTAVRSDAIGADVARDDSREDQDVVRRGVARRDVPRGDSGRGRHCGSSAVQTRQEPPPASAPGPAVPAFFFPRGRPRAGLDVDGVVARVERAFAGFGREEAGLGDMGVVAKACGCPLYWKAPLFYAAGGGRTGSVSLQAFVAMWRNVLLTCHDDSARFLQLLQAPGATGLAQEDLVPFLQDVVNTHPGLSFLKEAPEFHSQYITTVIQRLFYTVNRSWSGRITCAELRRSSFLQAVSSLEAEPNVNRLTGFFSYAHFYVIYCKFWELDTDHDLVIDREDLGRHGDGAISSRMIDRIFSGAVTRARKAQDGKLSYADFVWFLISEEDKTTPTSVEYWFRCMDLDGDGVLSMFELEFFYEEQARRMEARGVEPLPFRDLACQVLDMVQPRVPGRITLPDLKRSPLAAAFFDAFVNVEKFLEREQWAGPAPDADPTGPKLSDWERYAAEEYESLVAEEAWGEGESATATLCPRQPRPPCGPAPHAGPALQPRPQA
ncbi:Ppp2r3b [Phodopus roborovskii]|uniref:Ppp2r3b protein n=1 Tax=Phodopus roborovskii TaxID=109678 RepID=A0AAU9YR50_PHORO|nr:Ppp2r3b [Phodopus roborovskii]